MSKSMRITFADCRKWNACYTSQDYKDLQRRYPSKSATPMAIATDPTIPLEHRAWILAAALVAYDPRADALFQVDSILDRAVDCAAYLEALIMPDRKSMSKRIDQGLIVLVRPRRKRATGPAHYWPTTATGAFAWMTLTEDGRSTGIDLDAAQPDVHRLLHDFLAEEAITAKDAKLKPTLWDVRELRIFEVV